MITLREAVTPQDVGRFWAQLHAYYARDIFPDPQDEERAYFLGPEHREDIERVHARAQDRCHYFFFCRDGQDIGLALPVIYGTEDGKCFILEFCVFPEHRGGGTGTACAQALLRWARESGAAYAELNNGGDARRERFWQRLGFAPNGMDEWGNPLMLLPPAEDVPFTVERLEDAADGQLMRLMNGFRAEVGETLLDEDAQERLAQDVRAGRIAFFAARRGYQLVAMCSVAACYSTLACGETGVLDDFFIEPVFRRRGLARRLTRAAQDFCRAQGMASLTVCCAPCDEGMYQALGFDTRLGATYAHLTDA